MRGTAERQPSTRGTKMSTTRSFIVVNVQIVVEMVRQLSIRVGDQFLMLHICSAQ
jgi:hypothetical protein